MNIAFLFAVLTLAATAAPSLAQAGNINSQVRVAAAMRQGCSVQQVHTPAGKSVHAAPIVRCRAAVRREQTYAGIEENAERRKSPE